MTMVGILLAISLAAASDFGQASEQSAVARPRSKLLSGSGGFPLTTEVLAMWASIDERALLDEDVLTFLIYFRGALGWHEGQWSRTARLEDEPAVIEFTKDAVVLRVEYNRQSRMLNVSGQSVPVDRANVFLVDHADLPEQARVVELGKHDLRFAMAANPAATWRGARTRFVRFCLAPPIRPIREASRSAGAGAE